MMETSSKGGDDPGEIIRTLATSASIPVLWVFACHCCRRIDSLIPTEAGHDALKMAEQFCIEPSKSLPRLTSVIKSAKADGEEMRARMIHEGEGYQMSVAYDAACAGFYAAQAARMTAEYCADPALEAADEISDMVALSRAFFTATQSEATDSLTLADLQAQFDQFYHAERLAHCDLLRTCLARGLTVPNSAADGGP
jgi:hypothetical protein